ncbi:energy-coupling factor transporter transmembrane component T family protein [Peptoniphilus indolicus]|uniref:ABC-type cobalt transport system, permease component CbiQ and related transporters n=2 Tax=Peptoniphilus indolicus TaxID=33030 RepID=A0A379D8Y9_9FIRM|nr:energy-coupling factor transporter transmembrane component T [Peptoniphilus indolicus]SUB74448.1 ABC-type cobalt transport system, permease component CbiQ and related transporters [Peptoniphilus indolicus]
MREDFLKLDFRTKIFMSLILSYTLILGNIQQNHPVVAAFYSLLPYVFLFWCKEWKTAIKGLIFVIIAYIAQKEYLFVDSGYMGAIGLFITVVFLRLLPGLMMARYALYSSSMSEITLSLKKIRFPDELVIPIIVMARFFYTVKEDYHQVKDAMYLHGLTIRKLFFYPVKFFEYRIVPLLMILTKTADDVSISAMTKGLKIGEKRSNLIESKFEILDYFCFLLMCILIGFYLRGKYA